MCSVGPGHVSHGDGPAQLNPCGGTEGCHSLHYPGPGSHCGWLRALQHPYGLQHLHTQYAFLSLSLALLLLLLCSFVVSLFLSVFCQSLPPHLSLCLLLSLHLCSFSAFTSSLSFSPPLSVSLSLHCLSLSTIANAFHFFSSPVFQSFSMFTLISTIHPSSERTLKKLSVFLICS